MDAIELMVQEHTNIKRVLRVIRNMCIKVLDNDAIDYEDFYKVIDFVRNYADKHHHGKEEDVLFKKMGDELGERVAKGPIAGMLVEHDFGRLYIQNLEAALENYKNGNKESRVDIIANAVGYADLLNRHIDKEDSVIYTFARRALNKGALEDVNERCLHVEKDAEESGVQKKYLTLVDEFEKKYI